MMQRTLAIAAALSLAFPAIPALAQERLEEEIVSPVAEPKEDCEALRERLKSKRDDDVLNPMDLRELRDAGC